MERDDAPLAIERHATSKIRTAADLVGVRSFGFRGEALSAICSVSRFSVTTATADGAGTRVEASGGSVREVAEAARRRGTTVAVEDLFFNTPARARFLRGARSEWRAIVRRARGHRARAARRQAARHRRRQGGHGARAGASLRERVAGALGRQLADAVPRRRRVTGPVRVTGLVERPAMSARRRAGRAHRERSRGPRPRNDARRRRRVSLDDARRAAPVVLARDPLPGDAVDVNVHPAKAEVRFRDRWRVERAVERAVRRALGVLDSAALARHRRARLASPVRVTRRPSPLHWRLPARRPTRRCFAARATRTAAMREPRRQRPADASPSRRSCSCGART